MKHLIIAIALSLCLCGVGWGEDNSGVTVNPGPFNHKVEWAHGWVVLHFYDEQPPSLDKIISPSLFKKYEIGFRSDGVVVWRLYKEEEQWIRIPGDMWFKKEETR